MQPIISLPLKGDIELSFQREITWQAAYRYIKNISELSNWGDYTHPSCPEYKDKDCFLLLTGETPIISIRDWVLQEVGDQYEIRALFYKEGLLHRRLPDVLQITFLDQNTDETALLFSMRWRY